MSSPATQPTSTSQGPFRKAALDRLDVAVRIDSQLPLVPRRAWLIVIGCFLLALAGLVWAAFTPSETSVNAIGRVVAPGGLVLVAAPVTGSVASTVPAMGMQVVGGVPLVEIATEDGSLEVSSMTGGEVWQDLVSTGQGVDRGQTLFTIIPEDSERTAVVAVPESSASAVALGERAYVQADRVISGSVVAIQAPLPPDLVGPRLGLELPPGEFYVIITVAMEEPAKPGAQVATRIVLSDSSVLGRLLS